MLKKVHFSVNNILVLALSCLIRIQVYEREKSNEEEKKIYHKLLFKFFSFVENVYGIYI
jgi:hypothetical protein